MPRAGSLERRLLRAAGASPSAQKARSPAASKNRIPADFQARKIAKLGLAALIIEGQPPADKWYTLVINKDGVKFEDAAPLMGMGMYRVDEMLWEKYPDTAVIGLGPAGEMKLSNTGISVNDMENNPGRYAGRGGLGAVMGARGLKAIVVDDSGGPGVDIANMDLFKQGRKKLTEAIRKSAPPLSPPRPG